MPTIFRPARPSRRFGYSRYVPGKGAISTAVFSMAGVAADALAGIKIDPSSFAMAGAATEAGTGGSIATATLASAGVGDLSGNGAGVISGTLSASGVGALTLGASAFYVTALTAAGAAASSFVTERKQITSTNILQRPVDCVLAGQQTEFKRGRLSSTAMTHAFGEPRKRRRR